MLLLLLDVLFQAVEHNKKNSFTRFYLLTNIQNSLLLDFHDLSFMEYKNSISLEQFFILSQFSGTSSFPCMLLSLILFSFFSSHPSWNLHFDSPGFMSKFLKFSMLWEFVLLKRKYLDELIVNCEILLVLYLLGKILAVGKI